jgi:hypothetical protein
MVASSLLAACVFDILGRMGTVPRGTVPELPLAPVSELMTYIYFKPYDRAAEELRRNVILGIVLSLAVHLAMLLVLRPNYSSSVQTPLTVDVVFEPKLPSKVREQIVSPPDKIDSTQKPDVETKFKSDVDSVTEKEQIHRGDQKDAGPVAGKVMGQPQPAQPQTKPQKEVKASPPTPKSEPPPKLTSLKLDSSTILEKLSVPSAETARRANQRVTDPLEYRPFTRPFGSGAAFVGSAGTNDYLPNLPDGDITLLNAKADQFAVFVRRVAVQVFTLLRSDGWETLRAEDISGAGAFSTVKAILSPKGALLKVLFEGSSGSRRFDEVLSSAVNSGARDPNPPPSAASPDGTYIFIFKAKSWVQMATNPRNGAPAERRWLMLGTGLE